MRLLQNLAKGRIQSTLKKSAEHRCRYTEDRDCQVLWSVGLHNESDLASLLQRAGEAGIPTQDISSLQEAQVSVPVLRSTDWKQYWCQAAGLGPEETCMMKSHLQCNCMAGIPTQDLLSLQ